MTTPALDPTRRRTAAQIVDAVAEAAHRLFVRHGPASVSVRDIAGESGVNLGLIHRYVGSKDDVVALVLERHGRASRDALDRAEDIDGILDLLSRSPSSASGRLFAGILLDDIDALRLKREFPVADAVTRALAEDDRDPAVTAALLQSLVLGWEIFSDYLLGAAGAGPVDDEPAVLRRALDALVRDGRLDAG